MFASCSSLVVQCTTLFCTLLYILFYSIQFMFLKPFLNIESHSIWILFVIHHKLFHRWFTDSLWQGLFFILSSLLYIVFILIYLQLVVRYFILFQLMVSLHRFRFYELLEVFLFIVFFYSGLVFFEKKSILISIILSWINVNTQKYAIFLHVWFLTVFF